MSYENIKTLKGQVESVLQDIPETRNSDIALTIEIWRRFFPDKIRTLDGGAVEYVSLGSLYSLPREDNVKRVRAMFQNVQKKYLPTKWEVAKARGIEEDEWRTALGYPTKESTGTGDPSYEPPSSTGGAAPGISRGIDRF